MMITLITDKKDVDSGQYPIEDLQEFSKRHKSTVIIRDYARIHNGTINFVRSQSIDKALEECKILQQIRDEMHDEGTL